METHILISKFFIQFTFSLYKFSYTEDANFAF